jgi:hypothetical protein
MERQVRFRGLVERSDRLNDRQGHFREILTMPPNQFETLFSYDYLVGVAKTGGCPIVGGLHPENAREMK